MASLQVRHSRACAIGKPWTPAAKERMSGCDCGPTYYVIVREGRKLQRERVGKDRQSAERALRKIGTEVDEGDYRPQENVRFAAWADRWLAALEVEHTTRRAYRQSVKYGKAAFGDKRVRSITPDDVQRLNETLRARGLSPSTRARHLRALRTCFASAARRRYTNRNPVSELPEGERPRADKREAAYFERAELAPLFAALEPGVYRTLCLVALQTGARLGELLALTWADVDLAEAVIHVRRNYVDGIVGPVKTERSERKVDLTPDVVEILGRWWGELGRPAEDKLVFPGGSKSGYIPGSNVVARELYRAMARGSIPRVGPTGEKRTFHSFRHSFAKTALENGAPLAWLSRHLGHSSTLVTDRIYGHFEAAERRRQVQLLDGAFGVEQSSRTTTVRAEPAALPLEETESPV